MSAMSASRADAPQKVLVWDAPVRVFHWLMVLCFAGAYVTAESETWRLVHVTLGYTMLGLTAFRLLWGLVGTRYARFASFVKGPQVVKDYLRAMLARRAAHHVGHNPAGAVSILLLLALTLASGASGWAAYNALTGEWVAELHELVSNGMLAIVGLHVAGVVASSVLHRENLARAMVSGHKHAAPDAGIAHAWRSLAAVMLLAVLGFWWLQWHAMAA